MARERIRKKERIMKQLLKTSFILFIALTLVLSTFLIIADMGPNNQGLNYNGIVFNWNQEDGTFTFRHNEQQIRTHAHPIDAEVHRLSVPTADMLMNAQRISIVETKANASEWEPLAAFSLAEGLRRGNNIIISRGYTDSDPMMDCDMATDDNPMVVFKRSSDNNILENNSCITVEYIDESFLFTVKDSILYHSLGIISPRG